MKNIIGILLTCIILNLSAFAGNYTWTGTTNSNWGTSSNWSPSSGVPGSSDTININSTTNSLTLTAHQTVKRLVINSGVLNLGGDTLTITTSTGLNGGTINNGLFDANCTALVNFNGTTFGAVVIAKGQIKLNGCVFNNTASFEHIGSATGTGDGGNTFNGVTTLKNSGTTALRLAVTNADTFNNDVIIKNVSPSGSGNLQLSYGAATYFNGNIEISSTSSFGISFSSQGAGSSILASGKAMSIGSAGFTGTLVIQNFTQTGSTAQTLSISSVLNMTNSTFNGSFTSTSTSILLSGCTFNNVSSFTKTGTSHDYSAGGNYFANNSTFTNSASNAARIRLANSSGDTFGGDATFNTSNGLIEVAYVDTTIFQGDVTINNSKVTFNNSSGFVMCIGSASQEFGGSADYKIGKLIMNKTVNGVTLQRAATIDSSLTLTNGIIYTDTINLVTLKAGSTCSGASILSYVDGPMQKIGNTSFIFPIGKNGSIRKFGISAPSLVTENVRLELKRETPPNNTSLDTGLIKVCPNEFFHVRRTTGSSPIKVTLSWGNSSEEIPLPSNLSVAGWNGSLWKNSGKSLTNGSVLMGEITAADSTVFSYYSVATTNSNLTLDSIQFNVLKEFSLFTNGILTTTPSINSNGKIGCSSIYGNIDFADSILIVPQGSTMEAQQELENVLGKIGSLLPTTLSNSIEKLDTLPSGYYKVFGDLMIDSLSIFNDTLKKYIFEITGKLIVDSSGGLFNNSCRNGGVLFLVDTVYSSLAKAYRANVISKENLYIEGSESGIFSIFSAENLSVNSPSLTISLASSIYNECGVPLNIQAPPLICNYISNSGFYSQNWIPGSTGGVRSLYVTTAVQNWISGASTTTPTPDYYASNASSLTVSIPTQNAVNNPNTAVCNYQLDHAKFPMLPTPPSSVSGYVGIYVSGSNGREYIQQQMTNSLIAGEQYYGQFYTVLADNSPSSIRTLGMAITTNQLLQTGTGIITPAPIPQIEYTITNPSSNINSTVNWTIVGNCFTSPIGGENFVTIGNFRSDANSNIQSVTPTGSCLKSNSYYLIDDVSLTPISISAGNDLNLTCQGTHDLGELTCLTKIYPGQFIIQWILISGNPAFGVLNNSNVAIPTLTYSNPTLFAVQQVYEVTVSTPGGCTASDQVVINIEPCCSLTIDLTAENACLPATVGSITGDLTNGTAPYNIVWQQTAGGAASGNFNTSTSPFTISNLNPGTYAVTVTDDDGCTDIATVTIVSSANPPLASILGSSSACVDETSLFAVNNPQTGFTYSWSYDPTFSTFGATVTFTTVSSSSVNATFSDPSSNYLIQVTSTNTNGCTSISTFSVNGCCTQENELTIIDGFSNTISTFFPFFKISGIFTVNSNVTWNGNNILMDNGAEIRVLPGFTLTLDNVYIHPCDRFWKSITIQQSGNIISNNSILQGGQYAIDVNSGGGYFISSGTQFWDNYVGLRVQGAFSGGNARIFESSIIRLAPTNSLYNSLADYINQSPPSGNTSSCNAMPFAGIVLNFAGVNNVGSTLLNGRSSIQDAMFGIHSTNTFLRVVQTDIENCWNDPCQPFDQINGSGIYATTGFSTGNIRVFENGLGQTFGNNITNCFYGIRTHRLAPVVRESVIGYVVDGIRATALPPHFLVNVMEISDNNIKYGRSGVRVLNSPAAFSTSFFYNEFTDITAMGSFGGFRGAINVVGNRFVGSYFYERDNTIHLNFLRQGIYAAGTSYTDVGENDIFLNGSSWQRGIILQGCDDINVVVNQIYGDNNSLPFSRIGIDISAGGLLNQIENVYICNEVNYCSSDIQMEQNSTNMRFGFNVMRDGNRGLNLIGTIMGSQDDKFNKWCGTFNNEAIFVDPGSSASFLIPPSLPPTPTGCDYNPFNNGGVNGSGSILIDPTGTNVDPICENINHGESAIITSWDYFIADSLENVELDENYKNQLKRQLIQKLVYHPSLKESDSSMMAFWISNTDSDGMKLALMDSAIRNIYSSASSSFDEATVYSQLIDTNLRLIQILDSLLSTGLSYNDSLDLLRTRDEYSIIIDSLFVVVDSLVNHGNILLIVKADELIEALSNLDLTTEMGNSERDYQIFVLKYGPWTSTIITSEDSAMMVNLAHLCMKEYGPVVAWARKWIVEWFDEYLEDEELCNNSSRVSQSNQVVIPDLNIKLYPNPALDEVTIELNKWNDEYLGLLYVKIYTMQGQLINSYQLSGKLSNLVLGNFLPGVYLVEVVLNGDVESRKKLIIVK